MEDKKYNVDVWYPRVAALLRREYAGRNGMDMLLEKCTSVTPQGVLQQFEKLPEDMENDCGTLAMMREAAEKTPIRPLQCPFYNTIGCLNGDVWIIEHTRVEDGYNTTECRIRGHRCAAWSDALGRCLRIHPVAFAERHAMRKHNCDDSKIPPQMV